MVNMRSAMSATPFATPHRLSLPGIRCSLTFHRQQHSRTGRSHRLALRDERPVRAVCAVRHQSAASFCEAINANGMGGQLLDIADDGANAAIDRNDCGGRIPVGRRYLSFRSVGGRTGECVPASIRYLGDLHRDQEWGVSAYQTIQEPGTDRRVVHASDHDVRLSKQAAHAISERWRIGPSRWRARTGEYLITEKDTAWFQGLHHSEKRPSVLISAWSNCCARCFPPPVNRWTAPCRPVVSRFRPPQEWGRQVMVLRICAAS